MLFVTEGTYLDWGTRLIIAGKEPDNAIYDEWITIHGPDVLGELVEWLRSYLDSADLSPARVRRADDLFLTASGTSACSGKLESGTGGYRLGTSEEVFVEG